MEAAPALAPAMVPSGSTEAGPDELVVLWAGNQTVELCPAAGGAIAAFYERRPSGARHWLRPALPAAIEHRDVVGMACFPLVPFSNRVANARFRFNGEVVRLPRNLSPESHCIHGFGWMEPWSMTCHRDTSAIMTLRHRVAGTPFDFTATQSFTLRPDGLSVTLSVTNEGPGPMPAGLGLHPFFLRTPDMRLCSATGAVWTSTAEKLPDRLVPTPAEWSCANGREIGDLAGATTEVDHCFAGWNGRARLEWPADNALLTVSASPQLRHQVLWVPRDADFICLEPVSHATNAFNMMTDDQRQGVVILPPGESFQGVVDFAVGRLDPTA